MLCCPVCFQDYVNKAIKDLEAENQRLKAEVEGQKAYNKSGAEWAFAQMHKLNEELQAANLAHEQYREWAAGQMEQAGAALEENPIEYRYMEDGKTLDEIVVRNADIVHFEVMSDTSIWCGIYAGRKRVMVWIGPKNGRSHIHYSAETEGEDIAKP